MYFLNSCRTLSVIVQNSCCVENNCSKSIKEDPVHFVRITSDRVKVIIPTVVYDMRYIRPLVSGILFFFSSFPMPVSPLKGTNWQTTNCNHVGILKPFERYPQTQV